MSLELIAKVADEHGISPELARSILLYYADQMQPQYQPNPNPAALKALIQQNPQLLQLMIKRIRELEQATGQQLLPQFLKQLGLQLNSADQTIFEQTPGYVPPAEGGGEEQEGWEERESAAPWYESWLTPMGAIAASNWLLDPVWWAIILRGQGQAAQSLAQSMGGQTPSALQLYGGRLGRAIATVRGTPGEVSGVGQIPQGLPSFGSQEVTTPEPGIFRRTGQRIAQALRPGQPPAQPPQSAGAAYNPSEVQPTLGERLGMALRERVPAMRPTAGAAAPEILAGTGVGGTGLTAQQLAASGLRAIGTSGEVGTTFGAGTGLGSSLAGGLAAAVPLAIMQYAVQNAVNEYFAQRPPAQYTVGMTNPDPSLGQEAAYFAGSLLGPLNPIADPHGYYYIPREMSVGPDPFARMTSGGEYSHSPGLTPIEEMVYGFGWA